VNIYIYIFFFSIRCDTKSNLEQAQLELLWVLSGTGGNAEIYTKC
jgi:hypothetical protein